MQNPLNAEGRITVLNVGARILLKDTMDQYIRTLGDYKTLYAPTMASALRAFSEGTIHVVICETSLEDGSAYRLMQLLGGAASELEDIFVILALEERTEATLALAAELEAHSILVKPFAAADLKAQLEKYKTWKVVPKEPWLLLVDEAKLALREKKFTDAEKFYNEAIAAAPTHPGPYYRSGLYYLGKPDHGLAEGFLKKAVALKPDYTQALSALGTLYLAKRELDKAEDFFKKAQTFSPFNPDRMTEMVKVYLERAVEACRSTLRIDPGATMARLQLGKLMALQKDYVNTVRELEQVVFQVKDAQRNEAQTFMALARKLGGIAK